MMSGPRRGRFLARSLILMAVAIFVAAAGTSAATARSPMSPMAFQMVPLSDPARCGGDCVEVISAVGEITDATPQTYVDFLSQHANDKRMRALVFFSSPGGKVLASMKLGELLRSSGATAVVARIRPSERGSGHNAYIAPSACYSACVYALMGGRKRVVPPHSIAGIHRMFDYVGAPETDSLDHERRKIYDSGALGAVLEKYAGVMGVSPEVIAKAETVSSDSIHIVTPQEMRRWRLAVRSF
jgi:hypothetical protein